MDGGKTTFDDLIVGDDERVPIKLLEPDAEPEPEFDGSLFSNMNVLNPAHMATNLPKVPGCEGCGLAKAAKSPSRRRDYISQISFQIRPGSQRRILELWSTLTILRWKEAQKPRGRPVTASMFTMSGRHSFDLFRYTRRTRIP